MLAGRSRTLVSGLEQCQYALRQDGYLAAFPSTLFDRLEALQPVWVPYYTVRVWAPSCVRRRWRGTVGFPLFDGTVGPIASCPAPMLAVGYV